MTITMYSTSSCVTCRSLGDWLTKNGHSYTKKMVDSDDTLMAEFLSVSDGVIGVPFTVVTSDDGAKHKISGYDRAAFSQVLGL